MERPPEELKRVCDRLARTLSFPGGSSALRWMEALAAGVPQEPWPAWDWKVPSEIRRVGVWSRSDSGPARAFRRTPEKDPEGLWSRLESIEPKRGTRVVLIGESAAQGFLCAPYCSPALALEHILRAHCDNVEVLDITRLGMDLWELLDLMDSCRGLDPDAVVIFAGNNWNPLWSLKYGWNASSMREIGAILHSGCGVREVKSALLLKLERMVSIFLEQARTLSVDHGVPVLFVLPEFNLADWRDQANTTPLLPVDKLHRWLERREEAANALRENAVDLAVRAAKEMIDQDGGTHPSGYYLLADAMLQSGQIRSAREALEQARDANFCVSFYELSRCYGPIQRAMRARASQYGLAMVDCPQCIDVLFGGALPDRRVFLDFCHLNWDGIYLVAAKVAEQLLPIFGCEQGSAERLFELRQQIPARARAEICLLTALYNAVHDQRKDVIRFWLRCAVESHRPVGALMRALLNQLLRRDPLLFSAPLLAAVDKYYDDGLLRDGEVKDLRVLEHLLRWMNIREPKCLAVALIEALTEILAIDEPSLPTQVRAQLVSEHAAGPQPMSLLDSVYTEAPHTVGRSWRARGLAAYESYSTESSFVLVWDGSSAMEVVMTYRVPGLRWGGPTLVKVSVNGLEQARFQPNNCWRTVRFLLEGSALSAGTNRLTIVWPWPDDGVDLYRKNLVESLETGRMIEDRIMIPHGELFQLEVCKVQAPAQVNQRPDTEVL